MDIDKLVSDEAKSLKDDVREWTGEIGGQEVTLYSTPMSPYDGKMVSKKYRHFYDTPCPSSMSYLICLKAVDENGKKVFKPTHAPIMERWGLDKIVSISQKLFKGDFEEEITLEELEKNLQKTSTD